jgi:hypothetical protein
MAATTDVSVVIEPDAAARVAELGMEAELQRMLEHLKQSVPNLHTLRVEFDAQCNPDEMASIILWAHREMPEDPLTDDVHWNFGGWLAETFSPEVCLTFVLQSIPEEPHGR